MPEPRVIQIEVHGQRYPIRTTLDQSYVLELALYVDRKITLAADASPSSDTLGLAVLTALNIADELFRTRDLRVSESDSLSARAVALEEMVDQALQLAGHSRE
jgi:cell division protein ZapA